MKRFGVVLAAVVAIWLGIWVGFTSVSMLVGVGIGAYFFVLGQGANLSTERRYDVNSRIGTTLFASGLASAAIGHQPPYPEGFRVFYWVCMVIACSAALGFAWMPKRT